MILNKINLCFLTEAELLKPLLQTSHLKCFCLYEYVYAFSTWKNVETFYGIHLFNYEARKEHINITINIPI